MSATTVRLCTLDELTDGGVRSFEVGDRVVAVVRLGDAVYAIGDRCSHQDVSLGGGEVDAEECTIECPKHGSEFDLRTGEALSLPATKPVPTYVASVVDGDVMLELT
ncbi:MAG TPA: non-heme iron oxygenase ferredoxin subunit [Microthrixaceae bacterium]|nr:non-heme iron oxygenase ferredoxin subunit [Microthrixaceae bacterium]